MRFLPVNLTTFLVELADLDAALALHASLMSAPIDGIDEMIPAARTLMIRFRPEDAPAHVLARRIADRDLSVRPPPTSDVVEIPVTYAGEDLSDVARITGLSVQEIVKRHTESEFTVAFCGFAPGFAYLVGGDPALHVPRRQTPRTRIPAGAVAIAGQFSGVYPQASPGGWQLIGETSLKMWDLGRNPPALLRPGARVRFHDASKRLAAPAVSTPRDPALAETVVSWKVVTSEMPALFQDLGRHGLAGMGVSASGALDRAALKAANRIVGNQPDQACLEISLGTFSFTCFTAGVIGLTGARRPVMIRNMAGNAFAAGLDAPLAVEPGDTVTLGAPGRGMRSYLAARGGFDVPAVLGSASTDTLAVIGPAPVTSGTTLAVRRGRNPMESVSLSELPPAALPASGETVELDVILGPRADWFTPEAVATLQVQSWLVTPSLSRVGIRLHGDMPLRRLNKTELPSEGTVAGAIQVPHDGQPVLFLADHPLTGGYPVIGAVAEYHLDLAGQIPAHARIKFRPIAPFAEIRP